MLRGYGGILRMALRRAVSLRVVLRRAVSLRAVLQCFGATLRAVL